MAFEILERQLGRAQSRLQALEGLGRFCEPRRRRLAARDQQRRLEQRDTRIFDWLDQYLDDDHHGVKASRVSPAASQTL